MLYKLFFTFVLLCLFCPTMALANPSLSPRQEEIWKEVKAKLEQSYASRGIKPNPMPMEEIAAIKVPLVADGSKLGSLPWDAQMLLSFDRDFFLEGNAEKHTMFAFVLSGKGNMLLPDMAMAYIDWVGKRWFGKNIETWSLQKAREKFLSVGGDLPAALNFSVLDDLYFFGLWLVEPEGLCTPVVELNVVDGEPSFVLDDTCFLNRVLRYMDHDTMPLLEFDFDLMTSQSFLLTKTEQQAAVRALEPHLEKLNKVLEQVLVLWWPAEVER